MFVLSRKLPPSDDKKWGHRDIGRWQSEKPLGLFVQIPHFAGVNGNVLLSKAHSCYVNFVVFLFNLKAILVLCNCCVFSGPSSQLQPEIPDLTS